MASVDARVTQWTHRAWAKPTFAGAAVASRCNPIPLLLASADIAGDLPRVAFLDVTDLVVAQW